MSQPDRWRRSRALNTVPRPHDSIGEASPRYRLADTSANTAVTGGHFHSAAAARLTRSMTSPADFSASRRASGCNRAQSPRDILILHLLAKGLLPPAASPPPIGPFGDAESRKPARASTRRYRQAQHEKQHRGGNVRTGDARPRRNHWRSAALILRQHSRWPPV